MTIYFWQHTHSHNSSKAWWQMKDTENIDDIFMSTWKEISKSLFIFTPFFCVTTKCSTEFPSAICNRKQFWPAPSWVRGRAWARQSLAAGCTAGAFRRGAVAAAWWRAGCRYTPGCPARRPGTTWAPTRDPDRWWNALRMGDKGNKKSI